MYNIYCDDIDTQGYERKENAYIVLLLLQFQINMIFFLNQWFGYFERYIKSKLVKPPKTLNTLKES